MRGVRGKWVVVGFAGIAVANLALFFWARESTRGCFLTKEEIAGRWGEAPAQGAPLPTPEQFRVASAKGREPLVRGLMNEHALYGVVPSVIEERLGPPDGVGPQPGLPAYAVGDDGWNLVFVVGDVKGKVGVVRDVVVWKERCS
jgi:hypothetical protein